MRFWEAERYKAPPEHIGVYLMTAAKNSSLNHLKHLEVEEKFCREYVREAEADGESPEDCVLRECFEETGLTLTDFRYRGLVTFVSDQAPTEYMHLFTASAWTGVPHGCDEGELAWVPKEKVADLPIWEGDKIFLKLLAEDAPPFWRGGCP